MFATKAAIRDIAPHQKAVRLTGYVTTLQDGIVGRSQNGFHSGGAWLLNGEVWKPLDGCTDGHAVKHYQTSEERILTEMVGHPLIPHNFRFEDRNGRRWLIRPQATIVGAEGDNAPEIDLLPYTWLTKGQVLEVEAGVRNLNAHGWSINDNIQVAFNPKPPYNLFLYDLSIAGFPSHGEPDDSIYVHRFLETTGNTDILTLRKKGHRAYMDFRTEAMLGINGLDHKKIVHVYASFMRPYFSFSSWWPKEIEHVVGTPEESPSWPRRIPHNWIFTPVELPEETIRKFELEWAWSPLQYKKKVIS